MVGRAIYAAGGLYRISRIILVDSKISDLLVGAGESRYLTGTNANIHCASETHSQWSDFGVTTVEAVKEIQLSEGLVAHRKIPEILEPCLLRISVSRSVEPRAS